MPIAAANEAYHGYVQEAVAAADAAWDAPKVIESVAPLPAILAQAAAPPTLEATQAQKHRQ
jgi:hypothetical protein